MLSRKTVNELSKRPLLFPLLFFMTGIFAGRYFIVDINFLYIFFSVILLTSLALLQFNLRKSNLHFFLFFVLGFIFINPVVSKTIDGNNILNVVGDNDRVRLSVSARVVSPVQKNNDVIKFNAELININNDEGAEVISGKVLVRVIGDIAELAYGDLIHFVGTFKRPSATHNPGTFDYDWYLKRKSIDVVANVNDARLVMISADPTIGILSVTEKLRADFSKFIDEGDFKNSGLLKALAVGNKKGITSTDRETFISTGTIHLLAISGLHVGLVAFFIYSTIMFVLKRLGNLPLRFDIHRLTLILIIPTVIIYCLLAGSSIPTVRATIMAVAVILAILIGRASDVYNMLIVAAFAVLLFYPGSLWDLSFVLTFSAVISIVYLVPRLGNVFSKNDSDLALIGEDKWFNVKKRSKEFLFVNISATLGTLAIIAYGFCRVSIVSPVANLIAVPLIGFIAVPLSLLGTISFFLSFENVASFAMNLVDYIFTIDLYVMKFFEDLSFASIYVARPAVIEVFCFYIIIATIFYVKNNKTAKIIFIAAVAVELLTLSYFELKDFTNDDLKVTFISVGQGESTLIEFPFGKTMLIDGGAAYYSKSGEQSFDAGRQIIAPFLWAKKIKKIDIVVMTHNQLDHRGGLGFIIDNFQVDEFWHSGHGISLDLIDKLISNEVNVKLYGLGAEPRLIDSVMVTAIWPYSSNGLDGKKLGTNDSSLVLEMVYGNKSFLFTGDIGKKVEGDILKIFNELDIDVLKVAHHGSKTSSSKDFIDSVSPQISVISLGKNNAFRFPSKKVLKNLNNTDVYRTDSDGAVSVWTDGSDINVKRFLTDSGDL